MPQRPFRNGELIMKKSEAMFILDKWTSHNESLDGVLLSNGPACAEGHDVTYVFSMGLLRFCFDAVPEVATNNRYEYLHKLLTEWEKLS